MIIWLAYIRLQLVSLKTHSSAFKKHFLHNKPKELLTSVEYLRQYKHS